MVEEHGLRRFPSGAVRSTDGEEERFDLISPWALERLARVYKEGADKYGENNWLKGIPVSNLLNHALRHLVKYLAGDRSEDHIGHAAWNLFAIMHFEAVGREWVDVPRYGKMAEADDVNTHVNEQKG